MAVKQEKTPGTTQVNCPYCREELMVSLDCLSIPCKFCNRSVNVREILHPSFKKKKSDIAKKTMQCFKCGKEVVADKDAMAATCKSCYNRNDLSNYQVKSLFGKIIQTYGKLYLKKRGLIEISSVHVGDALIKGRLNGDLTAMGTVEILKHGEVHGNITCQKLIVDGGFFAGKVKSYEPVISAG